MMKAFDRLVNAGCDAAQARPINRVIRLSNISALTGAASYLFYAVYYSLTDFTFFLPALVVLWLTIPFVLSSIYLNLRGNHDMAGFVMNITISAPVYFNLWFFFGDSIGNHYFFILFSLLPIITISSRRRMLQILLSALNLLFFIHIYRHIPIVDLTSVLSTASIAFLSRMSVFFSLSAVIIVVLIYQKILFKSETALESQAASLKETLETGHRTADLDGLTGLYNRRFLERQFQIEILRAEREGTPFSVILFDLDRFKSVNDSFGHAVGDEVLLMAANQMRISIRSRDLPGRWGGDEFMIGLPGTNLHEGMTVAEKIRTTLELHPHEQAGPATGSFGVAEWVSGETVDKVVKKADLAMYRAKEQGRSKVVCAP